jgi:SAM-dependent methyltransferase
MSSKRASDVTQMNNAGDLFDRYAAAYEEALSSALAPSGESREYFAEGRVTWLKRRIEEQEQSPKTILDFGCGDGATTPLLVRALGADSAVGIDVSAKSLDLACKNYATAQIRYETVAEFQPSERMDLAYCNGVFHHIRPEHRGTALALVHRSLRDGGLFSFWENNPWSLATRYVMSRCAFDRDAIPLSPLNARQLLRDGGFEILRTDFRFIFPRALRVFRKIEDRVYRVPLGTQYQVLGRKVRKAN